MRKLFLIYQNLLKLLGLGVLGGVGLWSVIRLLNFNHPLFLDFFLYCALGVWPQAKPPKARGVKMRLFWAWFVAWCRSVDGFFYVGLVLLLCVAFVVSFF